VLATQGPASVAAIFSAILAKPSLWKTCEMIALQCHGLDPGRKQRTATHLRVFRLSAEPKHWISITAPG